MHKYDIHEKDIRAKLAEVGVDVEVSILTPRSNFKASNVHNTDCTLQ